MNPTNEPLKAVCQNCGASILWVETFMTDGPPWQWVHEDTGQSQNGGHWAWPRCESIVKAETVIPSPTASEWATW